VAVHIYTRTLHRTTQITTKQQGMRSVSRLCEFYPDICLTTEEKARKNLSQGKKNLSQFKKNLSALKHKMFEDKLIEMMALQHTGVGHCRDCNTDRNIGTS
jgi:hypothetical protein